jgi:hypothetical protein
MSFRGANPVNTAYISDQQAQNAVAALLGIGYGSRGYGYTGLTIPVPTSNTIVQATQWNALRAGINLLNEQNGVPVSIESNVTAGSSTINAYDGSNGRLSLPTIIQHLDTNRLYSNPEVMTLSIVLTSQRTTTWNYATNLYHEFTVNFGTEDAARYFFNTGGAIYISANRTSGPNNLMNVAVTQMLNEMGTIIFSATGVTYTGNNGNLFSVGFYNLTQNFEEIFSHYGDQSSQYSNISYILTVRTENVARVNGGNGSQLRFQAIFRLANYTQDQSPYQSFAPSVTGTLTSTIGSYLSTNIINVIQPTYATTVSIGP